ncbi:chaperonin 10-like protein [Baffinella frigidus]|nr:chaperonin 10-like protein [Cryptophyta sp. CCMP2293]
MILLPSKPQMGSAGRSGVLVALSLALTAAASTSHKLTLAPSSLRLRGGESMSSTCKAVCAVDTTGICQTIEIERRAPGPEDVDIDVVFCGICHSDLSSIRGEWPAQAAYPMVPGHEITGTVRAVGADVTGFKVGDRVGVGCFVDSCRECSNCKDGEESYCSKGWVGTYNALTNWHGRSAPKTKGLPGLPADKELTFGGYSQRMVVSEKYVLRIPDGMDMAKAAPLLCAGITTYSPLVYHGAKAKGKDAKVGVIGFGGLGHMCTKISIAMGNEVFVFSTSETKRATIEALGATFVNSKDPAAMAAVSGFHLIVDTLSVQHDIASYAKKLKTGGTVCIVGLPSDNLSFHAFNVAASERYVIDIKGLADEFEVEAEPAIDPTSWKVHASATIVPAEARAAVHAK